MLPTANPTVPDNRRQTVAAALSWAGLQARRHYLGLKVAAEALRGETTVLQDPAGQRLLKDALDHLQQLVRQARPGAWLGAVDARAEAAFARVLLQRLEPAFAGRLRVPGQPKLQELVEEQATWSGGKTAMSTGRKRDLLGMTDSGKWALAEGAAPVRPIKRRFRSFAERTRKMWRSPNKVNGAYQYSKSAKPGWIPPSQSAGQPPGETTGKPEGLSSDPSPVESRPPEERLTEMGRLEMLTLDTEDPQTKADHLRKALEIGQAVLKQHGNINWDGMDLRDGLSDLKADLRAAERQLARRAAKAAAKAAASANPRSPQSPTAAKPSRPRKQARAQAPEEKAAQDHVRQAISWFNKNMDVSNKGLTEEEDGALGDYTHGSAEINEELRRGVEDDDVPLIDAAMKKSRLPADVTVYRFVPAEQFLGQGAGTGSPQETLRRLQKSRARPWAATSS